MFSFVDDAARRAAVARREGSRNFSSVRRHSAVLGHLDSLFKGSNESFWGRRFVGRELFLDRRKGDFGVFEPLCLSWSSGRDAALRRPPVKMQLLLTDRRGRGGKFAEDGRAPTVSGPQRPKASEIRAREKRRWRGAEFSRDINFNDVWASRIVDVTGLTSCFRGAMESRSLRLTSQSMRPAGISNFDSRQNHSQLHCIAINLKN